MNIQDNYIQSIPLSHRKSFCQFYTPHKAADLMMSWLMEISPDSIYDPAFGMGAFYKSARKNNYKGLFIADELDNISFNFYKSNTIMDKNLDLRNTDYFLEWSNKYDAIICNPPYSRFQKFKNRSNVFNKLKNIFGKHISGHTNISSAFLLKSISELKQGGRLAYIMPVEFLSTRYGETVKEIMLEQGHIYEIIYIQDEDNTFKSVTTTACIVLFEKTIPKSKITKFSVITDATHFNIDSLKEIYLDDLNPKDKWLPLFYAKNDEINDFRDYELEFKDFVRLSEYGKFKRGIATGANEFFSLNKSQINDYNLKENEISICISKSTQIKTPIFTSSSLEELINNDSSIFIFNPNSDGNLSKSALNYISYGESKNYHNRYLTKNRKKWFSLEQRKIAPILFGVFSRDGYKIVRNKTSALNLTCFHGFEPTELGRSYIDKIFIFLKSELGFKLLSKNKRKYGKNLDKFEPSDLNSILLPSPDKFDLLPMDIVLDEMDYVQTNGKISMKTNNLIYKLFCNI
ncbi:HsdM family class I SAM-dependent methyltransferase [Neisseria uirgultaei]|uniref:HsdM family class I SAM-dependent methyltransferase n=1 Tax=Neisseria uirgultaei TaxID=2830646 RepID=UPI00265A11B7|nr:N-6 DNA methylase [Neisseria uirgultaei]